MMWLALTLVIIASGESIGQPVLQLWTVDLGQGLLCLVFDIEVEVYTCDPSRITLLNSSNLDSAVSLTLTSGTCTAGNNSMELSVFMSEADLNDIKSISILTGRETSYLTLMDRFITDTNGNSSLAVNVPLQANTYTPPFVELDSANLDLDHGLLVLVFTDSVAMLEPTLIFITDSGSTYNITFNGSMVLIVPDTFQVNVFPSQSDLFILLLTINISDVFVVIPSDGVANGYFIPAKIQLNIIPDTTRPNLLSWGLKINEEILMLTFNEPMSDMVNLEQTFILNNSTDPPFVVKYNLTDSNASVDHDALVITLELSDEIISAINSDALTIKNTFLVLGTDSFSDISGNHIIPITEDYPILVSTFIIYSLPSVESFTVDLSSGSITITFSEPVQTSSFQPSGISLLNAEFIPINLLNENMTNFSDRNTVVTIILSYKSLNQLKVSVQEYPLEIFMTIDSSTAQDMSGNAVQNISNNPLVASAVILDMIAPSLVSVTAGTPPNYLLIFVFDEYINLSTVDATSLSITFISPSIGSIAYNSFNGIILDTISTGMLDTIIYIFENTGDIGILYQIAFYSGQIYINISSNLVEDFYGNILSQPLEPVILEAKASDPGSPSLDSFTLDLMTSMLQLNFSEPIFVVNPVHSITIVNSDTSPTNAYALNDSSYAELEGTNGQSIAIMLTPPDVATLLTTNDLASEVADTYITISMDFGVDFSGNSLNNMEALQALCVNEVCGDGYVVQCVNETDETLKLLWNKTNSEMIASQNCPSGFTGHVTRKCSSTGNWDQIDFTNCIAIAVDGFRNLAMTFFSSEQPDIEDAINLVHQFTNITEDMALTGEELDTLNFLARNFVDLLFKDGQQLGDDFVYLIDNAMHPNNNQGWQDLQQSKAGSEELLYQAESYGYYLAKRNMTTSSDIRMDKIEGERFAVCARHFYVGDAFTETTFTLSDSISSIDNITQVIVPKKYLESRATGEKGEVSIIFMAFTTLQKFLPASNNSDSAEAIVISTQVVSTDDEFMVNTESLLNDNPIEIKFILNVSNYDPTVILNVTCVYWNFTSDFNEISQGGWISDDTISTDYSGGNVVSCYSSHLTSFSVLVNVIGFYAEAKALSYISYIGCGVSITCLVLTICILVTLRKELFTHVFYFIHLNLAISLLLGLIVFVSGIETAASSPSACKTVAVLLHYFFLCAFSWMLCEGIMLYLMLVVVFSKMSKRWWIYLIIGWGLPVIPVVITLGAAFENYEKEGGPCWLNGFYSGHHAIWGFVVPMLAIICFNCVILVIVIIKLVKTERRKRQLAKRKVETSQITEAVIEAQATARNVVTSTIILLPLLGITWIVGLFAVNETTVAFAYLFTILNSLQGVFIFVFHILRSKLVREKIETYKRRRFATKSAMVITKPSKVSDLSKQSEADSKMQSRDQHTVITEDTIVPLNEIDLSKQSEAKISDKIQISDQHRVITEDTIIPLEEIDL